MIKSELISRIAEQNPRLYAKDTEKAVNTILDEIAAALVRIDRVELRGFGTFTVRTWGSRPLGRNPKTGAPVSIPETRHPSFKTGKEMRDRLNATLGSAPRAAFHKP
jgi:integration host factor subunit beta